MYTQLPVNVTATNRFDGVSGVLLDSSAIFLLAVGFDVLPLVKPLHELHAFHHTKKATSECIFYISITQVE